MRLNKIQWLPDVMEFDYGMRHGTQTQPRSADDFLFIGLNALFVGNYDDRSVTMRGGSPYSLLFAWAL
jgi:hypothetical protein